MGKTAVFPSELLLLVLNAVAGASSLLLTRNQITFSLRAGEVLEIKDRSQWVSILYCPLQICFEQRMLCSLVSRTWKGACRYMLNASYSH